MAKLDKRLIEEMAEKYSGSNQQEKNDITAELFRMYHPYIQRRSAKVSEDTGIGAEEFESRLCEKIWDALKKWNKSGGASFYTYLRRIQDVEIAKVIRDEKSKNVNEISIEKLTRVKGKDEGNEAEDLGSIELSYNIDNEELNRNLIRKDQRQLVSDLVRGSGKNTPKVNSIVNVFLSDEKATSLQYVGDVLGESKQTVSNRLKSLRKVFGEHDFGMISDYYVA